MAKMRNSSTLRKWTRKIHIYLGLYMLLFFWLFAISGLFMNHPGWFKQRGVRSVVEQEIVMPELGTNLNKAHDIMDQLDVKGEVVFRGKQTPGKFRFIVLRPDLRMFVTVDLATNNARVARVEAQFISALKELHVFTGVRRIFREKDAARDWLPTMIWSFSMDALAAGLIILVLSSLYMGWQRKESRVGAAVSFFLGVVVFAFFMWGLRHAPGTSPASRTRPAMGAVASGPVTSTDAE